MPSNTIPAADRRDIFEALVAAQDAGQTVAESHHSVATEFGVTPAKVKAIETEGLKAGWPPLDE